MFRRLVCAYGAVGESGASGDVVGSLRMAGLPAMVCRSTSASCCPTSLSRWKWLRSSASRSAGVRESVFGTAFTSFLFGASMMKMHGSRDVLRGGNKRSEYFVMDARESSATAEGRGG